MPLTEEEKNTCGRICRIASDNNIAIEELDTIAGISFHFRLPDGRVAAGRIYRDRDTALYSACKELLPHITHLLFTHV